MTRIRGLLLAGSLASAALVPLASGADLTFPGKPTALVYQAKGGQTYDLYRAGADGKGPRFFFGRPTTDEFNPSWSPSGTRLVFQSGPTDGSNFDLWIVNADGKGARPLLEGKTNDRAPQFCDEDTVVFTRQLSATSSDVWALELRNGRLRRLTTSPGIDSFPTCNPRAERIAFISAREGLPRIYEMTVSGAGQRPLVPAPSVDPDYSPDGKLVAYAAPDPDGYTDVFTMDLATGAVTRKSNAQPPYDLRLPAFAPALAGRSLAGAGQGPGELAATRRHRTTGATTVVELPSGADLLAGEDAVWDFGLYAPACKCTSLRIKVSPSVVFTGLRESGGMRLKVFLDGTLRCTKGVGDCVASATVTSKSNGLAVGKIRDSSLYKELFCEAGCGGADRQRFAVELSGDARYGFGRRGTGTGALYARLSTTAQCDGKTRERTFQIHFDPDTGKLDYDRSDLDGNGQADGAG